MEIALVVPTIRPEKLEEFELAWRDLFIKHQVHFITVWDGDDPYVEYIGQNHSLDEIMGSKKDLIFNKSDCVRNLGFAYIAKYLPNIEIIITLDDDVEPVGDTIQDHINILSKKAPITRWINTLKDVYPRGFPYGIRNEAQVMVSHGLWSNVLDLDAPTQLLLGTDVKSDYNRFIVPKGCLIPFCGMNIAFRREVLPYVYYAPMGHRVGFDRFADIFMGVSLKEKLDQLGYAMATGYAEVKHLRASNVFVNLVKEAKGIPMHEKWDDEYFKLYQKAMLGWVEFINKYADNL